MRKLAIVLVLLTRVAAAHPKPPPDDDDNDTSEWRGHPALFEWSTWIRLGFGLASSRPEIAVRAVTQPPPNVTTTWDGGLGADMSVTLTERTRLGAWGELRGLEGYGGGEFMITGAPRQLEMFQYSGEGQWILRAGGSRHHATASIARGYRCPWTLWGRYSDLSRYEIGARIVLTATRSYEDPADWSVTFGLEFEPVGAIRYIGAIKSWY